MSRLVRSPEIKELKAFCAAADLGSLGRAARLLRVSQPAISKQLRGLEQLAGAKLLDRSTTGVRLTPAGRELYVEARKLLDQMETIESHLEGAVAEDRAIRLAVSPTVSEFMLPMLLASYDSGPQHLSLELTVVNSSSVQEMVREGRADLGIAALDPDEEIGGLTEVLFCQDEVIIAVPLLHTWAQRDEVPLKSFLRTPMIMRDPEANTRRVVESVLASAG